VFHKWTKHVEIDFHFVRERVADKTTQVLFILSKDQITDVLTKLIVSTQFKWFCYKLNVCESPLNLRGNDKAQDKTVDKVSSLNSNIIEDSSRLNLRDKG
jgi:hypothetical protein